MLWPMFIDDEKCNAVLLIDEDNAFNRINRKEELSDIMVICPIIATYMINSTSWM